MSRRPVLWPHLDIPVIRRLLLTLTFVAGVLVLTTSVAAASAPAPKRAVARFEIDFMQDMIDHHAMAVEMGEACLDQAVHAQLRSLCEQIIAAPTTEIRQLQAWLADWYDVDHQPEMSPGMMRQLERLASLSGARFEIEFIQRMIRHHRQAIVEAERCLGRAFHGELVDLCEGIIEAQSREIAQMEAWLCQWYGICAVGTEAGARPRAAGNRRASRAA